MGKLQKSIEKLGPHFMKFAKVKPLLALKDGLMLIMPLTLVGSIFLLLAFLPIPGWENMMKGIFGSGWQEPLFQVTGATFDIIALVAVFGVAYTFAKNENCEAVSAGILGVVSFIIVTNSFVMSEGGEKIGGVLPKAWTGGKGMIASIVIGLFVGYVYTWCIKKNLRIKMPGGVPEGVSNAFAALIPGFIITTSSMLIYVLFKTISGETLIEWVYKVLQIPLQGMTDSIGGAIAIPLLISLFWWFGIHGPAVVMGVMGPIVQANALANQEIINNGGTLIAGENARVVTQQFVDQFITFGGSGMTLGLVIAMIFLAKSAHAKKLGKLSIVPGLFNINEPVIFGFPIVLNPIMLVPFVLVPTLSGIITYLAIASGFMTPFTAVQLPWTTPPILSGFIVGGWQGSVLQAMLIAMAAVVYYPFLKAQDKQYLIEEEKSK